MTASSQVSVGLTASRNSSPHATASVRSACVRASTSASAHAAGKFEAVAQLLLANGAAVDAPAAEDGYTPLHMAVAACQLATVRVLLEHGADRTKKANNGCSPGQVVPHPENLPYKKSTSEQVVQDGDEILKLLKSRRL